MDGTIVTMRYGVIYNSRELCENIVARMNQDDDEVTYHCVQIGSNRYAIDCAHNTDGWRLPL